jgi:hypothetical protein
VKGADGEVACREVLLSPKAFGRATDRASVDEWRDQLDDSETPSLKPSLAGLIVELRQLPDVERLALLAMYWGEMPIARIARAASRLTNRYAVMRAVDRAQLKLKLTSSHISVVDQQTDPFCP